MKALVMGGTQFNGLALVKELVKTGHEVTILNRGQSKAEVPRRVKRLYCDRTDQARMRKTLGGEDFDCVFDISAYRPEDVELMAEIFRGRIGHYIFASSTVIYAASKILPIDENFPVERGDDQNEYGLNKILCEDILMREYRERNFPVSIAAFSMVFGPNNIIPEREQRMYVRIARGRPVLIPGDGTTVQQVGHVFDEARALRMMMLRSATFGRRYNLTGGDCYSDEGYVDTFAQVVGSEPEKIFVPHSIMDDLFAGRIDISGKSIAPQVDIRTRERNQRDAQLFQLQRLMQRIAPNIHGWNNSVWFSIEQLKRDVGWEPEFNFESGVEQTWKWMREEGLDESRNFDFSFEDDLIARIRA
ncbi:MAG: NAD-dependent epimerase/dehydratase family protein [Deltaproteobacteria bacterium]|nr:NAD-dependent epimerase/dehydratase family protein [Deltaproteobacteria bacterium]